MAAKEVLELAWSTGNPLWVLLEFYLLNWKNDVIPTKLEYYMDYHRIRQINTRIYQIITRVLLDCHRIRQIITRIYQNITRLLGITRDHSGLPGESLDYHWGICNALLLT